MSALSRRNQRLEIPLCRRNQPVLGAHAVPGKAIRIRHGATADLAVKRATCLDDIIDTPRDTKLKPAKSV